MRENKFAYPRIHLRILNDSLVTCVHIYIDLIQMTVTIVSVVCIIQFGRPVDKQIIRFKGNRSLRPPTHFSLVT